MLHSVIWWLGIGLAFFVLLGGYRAKLLLKYPFFYTYAACVFIASILLYFLYHSQLTVALYDTWYWTAEFLTLVAGYGILLEIFNHVLGPYPGAVKFARTTGIVAFGVMACFAWLYPTVFPQWSPGTVIEFERDLRTVQALFLSGLLVVVSYYRITISRNMKGMIAGYGLYIATSLMSLALRSYAGMTLDAFWKIAQPASYDLSLLIWFLALSSYTPTPVADPGVSLDADYQELAARTRSAVRSYFHRTARP